MSEELRSVMSKYEVEKLNMSNYGTWSCYMEMLLRKKNLWEIAKGTEKLPENASEGVVKKHKKRQNEAAYEIGLRVGAQAPPHAMTVKTPVEMWSKLKKFFNDRNKIGRAHV